MIKPDEIDVNDKAEDLINDHFVEGSDLKKFTHAEQSDKVCTCCDMLVMEIDKNYQLVAGTGGEVSAQKIHSISFDIKLSLAINHTHLTSLSYILHTTLYMILLTMNDKA